VLLLGDNIALFSVLPLRACSSRSLQRQKSVVHALKKGGVDKKKTKKGKPKGGKRLHHGMGNKGGSKK